MSKPIASMTEALAALIARLESTYREMGTVGAVIGRKAKLTADDLAQMAMVGKWQWPLWDAVLELRRLASSPPSLREWVQHTEECDRTTWEGPWRLSDLKDCPCTCGLDAALTVSSPWQDISTAPKDGTAILAYEAGLEIRAW